jgi:hypothetical protein
VNVRIAPMGRRVRVLARCTAAVAMGAMSSSCEDRYQLGYDAGYAAAFEAGAQAAREECETAASALGDYTLEPSVATEVCGGDGVNVNGKHFSPGPTGCVRVYDDGTSKSY